jgi:hypothetical protein
MGEIGSGHWNRFLLELFCFKNSHLRSGDLRLNFDAIFIAENSAKFLAQIFSQCGARGAPTLQLNV